ncbi:Transcriptional regulator, AraC-related [Leptospira biflexa serovar Patoc strain 'Patoc 1 (Ames)']|uniref:Putative AraC-type transcriptional regulator n=1 Tax=Leptospira biflexa serovar Patoc (strain Patoc 1 / ATCC 23582 / Paris) TaxID=456481 RepID=B0SPF7_LEPBP|nr:AraC family transcriptional regulator [Leptospira biflexa]ABZ95367.1 Transcriptional regulator, AraC-related [Leptospira biflexa serovar Patoc strain 'Patoc 1 (Ames)']ABZ99063.1 Putative AraC-type transcriptional regulator [Leptospira biflexa serovar Patoc strain 'Patoc 1 (Paris)']
MDLLSDILFSAGWKNDLLSKGQIFQSFGFHFPCERSGGFHVVTQGSCYARIGKQIIPLQKGDLLFITRGVHHELLSDPKAKVVTIERFLHEKNNQKIDQNPVTTFVSVRYEVPDGPVHPLLLELPDYILIPYASIQKHHSLEDFIQILSKELELNLGTDLIVQRLTDIMLYYMIRIWLQQEENSPVGWIKAFHDKTVLYALEKLHNAFSKEWTIESLAKETGVSRANLANKFRDVLGIPPMEYLAKLRMEKAKQLFQKGNMGLEEIAQNVGYASAFSFSKAYKRIYGNSPSREWKRVI